MNLLTAGVVFPGSLLVSCGVAGIFLVRALRRRYRKAVTLSYFEGFRDGVAYEAKANHASAVKGRLVQVPLSGVN